MGQRGFDLLAPHYHWMECVVAGSLLQRSRMDFLGDARPREVLLAGEGHGRFLGPLVATFPEALVTYVDASAAMIEVAKRRLAKRGDSARRVTWIHASLPVWEASAGRYNLVVTNFFLDCFGGEELRNVVAVLARACSPQAAWIMTDFHIPSSGLLRIRAKAALWLMYRFFRVVTQLKACQLEDPAPWISQAGFSLRSERFRNGRFIRSQLWERGRGAQLESDAMHPIVSKTAHEER